MKYVGLYRILLYLDIGQNYLPDTGWPDNQISVYIVNLSFFLEKVRKDLCIVNCTFVQLYIVHCTFVQLYIVQCSLYIVQCSLYICTILHCSCTFGQCTLNNTGDNYISRSFFQNQLRILEHYVDRNSKPSVLTFRPRRISGQ